MILLPWPRNPTITAGGKLSLAKAAGKPVPWLSANQIGVMHPRHYRAVKHAWREVAVKASAGVKAPRLYPVRLRVLLYKRTAIRMDPFAILEGMKPILDGMVEAGVFPDDSSDYVIGGDAWAIKAADLSGMGVLITWATAPIVGDPSPPSSSPTSRGAFQSAAGTVSPAS